MKAVPIGDRLFVLSRIITPAEASAWLPGAGVTRATISRSVGVCWPPGPGCDGTCM